MNCLPPMIIRSLSLVGLPMMLAVHLLPSAAGAATSLKYSVTWVGNSFPGASNKWIQNFFIHTKVQPDGTVNTWSHWDEGGKKFGVYKDGDSHCLRGQLHGLIISHENDTHLARPVQGCGASGRAADARGSAFRQG